MPKRTPMDIRKRIYKNFRGTGRKLRLALLPTPSEQYRAWKLEEERTNRYAKYIPHYLAQVYIVPATWFFLMWFVYFMLFGISMNEHNNKMENEPRDTADTIAIEHDEYEYAKQNPPIAQTWNYIMKPLNLDKDTYFNWLILLQGTLIGLTPTLALSHRKRIVDKMYAEKWKLVSPIDKTDRKIIHDMSMDAPNYFYHLTLSLTGPEKLKKYKKIAIPIIQGYAKSHPQDNAKTMAILKAFNKTK